jgi:flagellar export protein FliJ
MKKFQFRPETLLRLREATRDERRSQLADAFRVAATLDQQHAELERGLAAVRESQRSPTGSVDVDRLLNAQRYEMVLQAEKRQVEQQQAAVAVEIERRREALVLADQDVRALEKLRETQARRWREEEERQSMKELDEVAGRRSPREGQS